MTNARERRLADANEIYAESLERQLTEYREALQDIAHHADDEWSKRRAEEALLRNEEQPR